MDFRVFVSHSNSLFPLFRSLVVARPLSSSSGLEGGNIFNLILRKVKKFYYGSETPYVRKDNVFDQLMAAEKWTMPKVYAREIFLRDQARNKYLKHNEHIRHLENKVTGGAVGVKSFFNRF